MQCILYREPSWEKWLTRYSDELIARIIKLIVSKHQNKLTTQNKINYWRQSLKESTKSYTRRLFMWLTKLLIIPQLISSDLNWCRSIEKKQYKFFMCVQLKKSKINNFQKQSSRQRTWTKQKLINFKSILIAFFTIFYENCLKQVFNKKLRFCFIFFVTPITIIIVVNVLCFCIFLFF